MDQGQIWGAARKSSELVYRFNQGESPVLTQPGPWGRSRPSPTAALAAYGRYENALAGGVGEMASRRIYWNSLRYNGYCAALAVRWCVLRRLDSDFPFDARTRRCDGLADVEAVKQQSIYRGGTLENDWAEEGDLFQLFKRNGFVGVVVKQMNVAAYPEALRSAIKAAVGEFFYLSLKGSGGGHGVAIQSQRGGAFRYFDANLGHFSCRNAARFDKLFKGVMAMYTGVLDKRFILYRLDTARSGVKGLVQRFGG